MLSHEKKETLFENIIGLFHRKTSYEHFHALKNIDVKIEKGDFIGLIGSNGSGKSTLLRQICNILVPSSGEVVVRGRIASLLGLGVGFQGELTGKENVYLYGVIMGLSKKEIDKKYSQIVEFAGVKNFMDTKLRNFSSGMIVRLAFSTCIQTDPDILVLDEVLAVGDQEFQKKCYAVFEDLRKRGTTIIFASHDLDTISRFCNKTLYLKKGKQMMYGKTDKVVKTYRQEIISDNA
jgi:lipopolysaccharide transport system ATP-binding protein